MNSRRSFLKSMLVAAIAPSVLAGVCSDRFKWKRTNDVWVPNPEWVKAEYEVYFINQPGLYDPDIFDIKTPLFDYEGKLCA